MKEFIEPYTSQKKDQVVGHTIREERWYVVLKELAIDKDRKRRRAVGVGCSSKMEV